MSRVPFDPMKTAAMRAAQGGGKDAGGGGTPPLSFEAAGSAQRPLTISQANTLLAHALAAAVPSVFFVEGEISNFRTYDRGHAFFTLKDAGAELPCILWKDALARLKFKPGDGQAVIARGAVKMYEPQGRIQLYVETMWPQGAGALELAYRQLCEKLRKEGLFEAGRKRKLPRVPRHIAVITSRTGDVLHDVLTTAWRRYPGLWVSLVPVRVQGAQAAGDMVRGIEMVNRYDEEVRSKKQEARSEGQEAGSKKQEAGREDGIDLILLVRGGGSLEDLWAFNEEVLARAIVASRVPVATGIGHEPDTTIADLVGDLRGPTPTGVTELTVPDARALSAELGSRAALLTRDVRRTVTLGRTTVERTAVELTAAVREALRERRAGVEACARQVAGIEPRHAVAQGWRRVEESQRRLWLAVRERVRGREAALVGLGHRLERVSPVGRVGRLRDKVGNLETRLGRALRARLAAAQEKLAATGMQLQAVSPQAVMERGYSITTDKDGAVVRKAAQVKKGDVITTRLAEGEITSTVGKPKQATLF